MKIAVIKTGGKQYIVKPGDVIKVEKIDKNVGEEVIFDEVLLFQNDKSNIQIGQPLVKGVQVKGKIVEQGKDKKIIVFKYRPKKRYRKKQGHRQPYTKVEILDIITS